MSRDNNTEDGGTWYIPAQVMRLAGGEFLIKAGRPVLRARSTLVSKWCGVSTATLSRLAACGLIRCAKPAPGTVLYYPEEVEAFLRRTEEDPDFWNAARRKAFLSKAYARDLRTGKHRKTEQPKGGKP